MQSTQGQPSGLKAVYCILRGEGRMDNTLQKRMYGDTV